MSDAARRRYLRLYFDDLERDHPDVWYDPTCLSTFVRLLALSEKAWPAMPELPRSSRRADLAKLKGSGMIEYLPNDRYVLRGWLSERSQRAEVGRTNVGKRSDRTGVPTTVDTVVPTTVVPVRARPATASSTATSKDTEGVQGEPDPADAYWSLTGRWPTDRVRDWIDELAAKYGSESVIRHLALRFKEDAKTSTLMGRAQDHLRAEARALDRAEQDAERERLREKRAIPKVVPAWEQEFRAALEEKYGAAS